MRRPTFEFDASSFLTETVQRAGRSFATDELAFLALTSKIERSFLGRFAFAAQQKVPNGVHVAREFTVARAGRADVAILRNQQVSCIVEGKAMAIADCTRAEPKRREYATLLQQDLERYKKSRLPASDLYSLLLGVHPLTPVPNELRAIVKYVALLNGAFRRHQTAELIYAAADRNLRSYLRDDVVVGAGAFDGGVAFGVPVAVCWWLFGPFRAPYGLSILREHGT